MKKVTKKKIHDLQNDIRNSVHHIFGDHENCAGYFCAGATENEKKWIRILKASTGADAVSMNKDIMTFVDRLVRNAVSLLQDVDNNVCEQFNSVINSFLGGKRVNYALRGSYKTRCESAVVSYNSHGEFFRKVYKTMQNRHNPEKYTKGYIARSKKAAEKRTLRRKNEIRKKKPKSFAGPDEHYGNVETENMSNEEFEEKKAAFLSKNFKKTVEELKEIEEETVQQASSSAWMIQRKIRATASFFGGICKMRPTTSCKNMVYSILYLDAHTKEMRHGSAMEPIAKTLFEKRGKIIITNCGLFVDTEYQFLAASPDELVGDDAIIEIKCPPSADMYGSPTEAVSDKKLAYCDIEDGKLLLRSTSNYFYQVQGQLHITKKARCFFVICSKNFLTCEIIERDDDFWDNKMKENLNRFYIDCILPEIVNPQFPKRLEKRDIKDPPGRIIEQMKNPSKKSARNEKGKTIVAESALEKKSRKTARKCQNLADFSENDSKREDSEFTPKRKEGSNDPPEKKKGNSRRNFFRS